MLTVIFLITAFICYIVIAATYGTQSKYREGTLFAIALPEHVVDSERVQQIRAWFNRRFRVTGLWLGALLIPFILLYSYMAVQMIYFFAWLTVFMIVMVLPFRKAFRETLAIKHELLAAEGLDNEDGDEYWANGFTYHNPNDSRVFVSKRIGIGQTVNTATPAGKSFMWGTAVVVAGLLLGVSFLMIRSELTTPSMTITSGQVVEIHYPMYNFNFKITEIQELALVQTVPSGVKTNGEATNKYARGHFRLKEIGKSRLYIFKNNPPYIHIKLDTISVYYNDADAVETERLYKELQALREKG